MSLLIAILVGIGVYFVCAALLHLSFVIAVVAAAVFVVFIYGGHHSYTTRR